MCFVHWIAREDNFVTKPANASLLIVLLTDSISEYALIAAREKAVPIAMEVRGSPTSLHCATDSYQLQCGVHPVLTVQRASVERDEQY